MNVSSVQEHNKIYFDWNREKMNILTEEKLEPVSFLEFLMSTDLKNLDSIDFSHTWIISAHLHVLRAPLILLVIYKNIKIIKYQTIF